jgi:hypothetical protein
MLVGLSHAAVLVAVSTTRSFASTWALPNPKPEPTTFTQADSMSTEASAVTADSAGGAAKFEYTTAAGA